LLGLFCDFANNRKIGLLGWGGITLSGAAALTMCVSLALAQIPGSAGLVI
jgi:hypothetical protein